MAHDVLALSDITGLTKISTTKTVTVGSGGTYATINAALAALQSQSASYVSNGVSVVVNLLTGFAMAEQVLVKGIDLSWIKITSADATVSITRSALTAQIDDQTRYPAFGASQGGVLPVIDALFQMDTSGTATGRDGVYCSVGSRAIILPNRGVKNAGGDGCSAQRNSHIVAHQAVFQNAGENGIHAGRTSSVDASLTDVSGATLAGLYAWRDSRINAYTTSNCSNCGTYGLFAEQNGMIDTLGANCTHAGTHGIYALNGGYINASQVDCSNAGTDGIRAQGASNVNADSGKANACGAIGLHALYGAKISAQTFDASGNTSNGVYSLGAEITIISGNAKIGVSNSASDIVVAQGGIIRAALATGGTNVTVNTVGTNGVIFQ